MKLSGMFLATVIVVVSFVYAVNVQPIVIGEMGIAPYDVEVFGSYEEFIEFLRNTQNNKGTDHYYQCGGKGAVILMNLDSTALPRSKSASAESSWGTEVDYSETNIQVEGVDEPDVVKTDGTYLYIVSDGKLFIIKAYPPEDAKVLSEISMKDDIYISNIFINNDHLIAFGKSNRYPIDYEESENNWYGWGRISTTIVNIYDVSDRENPELVKDVEFDGNYFDSRMIGDWVYIIATEYTRNIYYLDEGNETINIPEITIDDVTKKIPADHIYFANTSDTLNTMTYVITINVDDGEVNQKSFILGRSQDMFVSKDNIFLTYTHHQYRRVQPLLGTSYEENNMHTIIHKISINEGEVAHIAQGNVPGQILNQFSMDEYDGYFRIATTISGYSNNVDTSTNNMFVLNSDLEIVGRLEGVAPGESIYSVRFMGQKAYMVTFRHIDPLFVIDLKDPTNPKILGKLKIPGYSDYLHPIDENHLIGIGKEVDASVDADKIHTEGAVYYTAIQGVKISIFDVSDVGNPIELHKVVIGDRGTESPATSDHKAFLFDKEKELLVIPLLVAELKEGQDKSERGDYVFQGSYVYDLSVKNGINLRGRVTHIDDLEEYSKSGYYFRSSSAISRYLYIGNVLYTISNNMIKMNNLEDLSEINSVELV